MKAAFYKEALLPTSPNTTVFGPYTTIEQLFTVAKMRKFNVVVFRSLSDISTKLGTIVEVTQALLKLKIEIIAQDQHVDEVFFHQLAQLNQSLNSKRTEVGMRFARAKGKRLGRPKTRNDRMIQHYRSQGLTLRAIAKELGCSKTSVVRGLRG